MDKKEENAKCLIATQLSWLLCPARPRCACFLLTALRVVCCLDDLQR
jgi:hypothetical protein